MYELAQKKKANMQQLIMKCHQPIVQKQNNSYDCGLYMLQYAEMFLTDEKYILENLSSDINKLLWFPKTLVSDKRQIIKILIDKLKSNSAYLQDYFEYRKKKE